jgi:SAM-dependent methyltransferase
MARPRRKRAQIDAALVSAEVSLRHLLKSCGDFPSASRERTERLVEQIEALALAMVLPQDRVTFDGTDSDEVRLILQSSEQFVERQLVKLNREGLSFATANGVRAFFLAQLFERLRQEVSLSQKDEFDRRASAAYFTPIGLSYYLVKTAFSGIQIGPKNLRLLDFCAGSGCLSIAALDYLSALSGIAAKSLTLLSQHFFAVEIDPLILRTWVACLAVACSATIEEVRDVAGGNFFQADALSASLPLCDVILSNPPWEGSSYLQFVERAGTLLAPGGVAAIITPAGIASDQGATNLRRRLFEDFHWQSLEGFSNEDLAFAIHPSYRYALTVFARTEREEQAKSATHVRFGSLASNLLTSESRWSDYSFALAKTLSPCSYAILECESGEHFDLFMAVASRNIPLHQLHEDGQMQMDRGRYKQEKELSSYGSYSLRFARDYDMSIDKKLFIAAPEARRAGFKPDCYGRYLQGNWQDVANLSGLGQAPSAVALSDPSVILSQDYSCYIERDSVEECLLPLIEGRMLGPFEIASKAYVLGSGRQALWHDNAGNTASSEPALFSSQYLVRQSDFDRRRTAIDSSRVGFVSVSAATNTRSMVAALLPSFPAGNSVPFLSVKAASENERAYWALIITAVFNSFTFDYVLRTRFGGNNLNYFLLDQCSVPQSLLAARQGNLTDPLLNLIGQVSAVLSFTHLSLVPKIRAYLNGRLEGAGLFATELGSIDERVVGHSHIQLPGPQRKRLRALLDALVARLYGLDSSQFAQVLSGCRVRASATGCDSPGHSRGFHRVDKQLPFDQRLPYLAYQIFQDIEMNRLDLNHLALSGFASADGSSGQGHSLLSNQLDWLKMHQTRLDPFHQKSGVK